MQIVIACGLDSRSRAGFWKNDRAAVRAIRTIQYLLTYSMESFLRSSPVNFAASQEIPCIYGTRKFLIVTTSARHLSLS